MSIPINTIVVNYQKLVCFLVIVFFSSILIAQDAETLWTKTNLNSVEKSNILKRKDQPTKFQLFNLNLELLKKKLAIVPKRNEYSTTVGSTIKFPNSKGDLKEFDVYETPIISSELGKKFPNIKSYVGRSKDKKGEVIRFSMTALGFHAIIINGSTGTYYIDSFTKDKRNYIVYKIKLLPKDLQINCGNLTNSVDIKQNKQESKDLSSKSKSGDLLRTFRIAVATTGEYSLDRLNYYDISPDVSVVEKKSVVLGSIVQNFNIVNAITERDLGLNFQLIDNTDDIIFLDPNSDGLTNGFNTSLIDEATQKISEIIGSNNYDIAHTIFSGGGGYGPISSFCNSTKQSATSGISPDIEFNEYVLLHELGHQLGSQHSFNNCDGSNDKFGPEVGCGQSIMSYTQLYDETSIEPIDVLYYHAWSIEEIQRTINGKDCSSSIFNQNGINIVEAQPLYNLPILTPFSLEIDASDANGGILTYTIQQNDTEEGDVPPQGNSLQGPAFQPRPPDINPNRTFPSIETLVNGLTSNTWEVLPSVSRSMNFLFTVRDNQINGGHTAMTNTTINFKDSSGPFKVVSQAMELNWNVGETQTILWDVANTNLPPINCEFVNILLSLDGGYTYPITISENTPNDGSEDIVVPDVSTLGARIKVESVGNIFFSLNKSFIAINPPTDQTFIPDLGFEKTLIELGYDDVLDSKVKTSNIEPIRRLELYLKGIKNLRGIEDFVALEELSIIGGNIKNLNLNENTNLKFIQADRLQLENIDVSDLINLEYLSVSFNKLKSLDISNNLLLADLFVTDNLLESLDLSKANSLFSLFATMNPLNCIQINSEQLDNLPSNWFKDDSAIYSLDCGDDDSDGVLNVIDVCPETPNYEPVDMNGCSIISYDTFSIYTESTSCPGVANGVIEISTKNDTEGYVFDVEISGNGLDEVFADQLSLNSPFVKSDLAPGAYNITIALDNGFSSVFDEVVIEDADDLSANKKGVNTNSKAAFYTVSGNHTYIVTVNDRIYNYNVDTNEEEIITVPLQKGQNDIIIKGAGCQSTYEDEIMLMGLSVYPNPVREGFYLDGGYEGAISIYNSTGQLVKNFILSIENNNYIVIQELPHGIYFVNFLNEERETLKIIKQ